MTNETAKPKRKPTHRVYHVTGDGEDSIWTPIAPCFPHKDGRGWNVPIPFIGRVVIREITDRESAGQGRLV
ncbi:hypothetical protein J3E64_001555 [Sphingobium sp. OAS761]|nr:hypothetical protein [Sphingobium sp. OAS761]